MGEDIGGVGCRGGKKEAAGFGAAYVTWGGDAEPDVHGRPAAVKPAGRHARSPLHYCGRGDGAAEAAGLGGGSDLAVANGYGRARGGRVVGFGDIGATDRGERGSSVEGGLGER